MLVGAFGALTQNNIKRLLAYSSIANIGYALIPIAVGAELGGSPLLLFMTLYTIASIGLFAGVLAMRRSGGMVENVDELSGLIRTNPSLALALTIIIFSVAGIPPLAGFWGKLEVITAGLQGDMLSLVILLIVSSVISLGYYLRLVVVMWVNDPKSAFEPVDLSVRLVVGFSALASLVLTVFIGRLDAITDIAASSLLP
ncbi:MAG: proton-conducting transporter membrane subunit [Pseudomonadota bacterium]